MAPRASASSRSAASCGDPASSTLRPMHRSGLPSFALLLLLARCAPAPAPASGPPAPVPIAAPIAPAASSPAVLVEAGAATAPASSYRPPTERADGWSVGAAEAERVSAEKLAAIEAAVRRGDFTKIGSVLVARHGKLVFEAYFDGDAATLRDTRSAAKSVTSMLVGIAIERRALPGVDARVFGYFADRRPLLHPDPAQGPHHRGGLPHDELPPRVRRLERVLAGQRGADVPHRGLGPLHASISPSRAFRRGRNGRRTRRTAARSATAPPASPRWGRCSRARPARRRRPSRARRSSSRSGSARSSGPSRRWARRRPGAGSGWRAATGSSSPRRTWTAGRGRGRGSSARAG